MLLERLIEPRLGEILERIAGILGGGSAAVLHCPCGDALLAADTLARPSRPSRRAPVAPPPLPRVALVALLTRALGRVHSDHGRLTTFATPFPTVNGQQWRTNSGTRGLITGFRALIDTQQLVCRIDDVHAKRMVSPRCSPDRAPDLPIPWLPWLLLLLLLPPPLLLPRLSAEPTTSLPANSSFMSPPRVTLPGHANSRIFLARQPPSAFSFPLFFPSLSTPRYGRMDPSTRGWLWGGLVPRWGSTHSHGTAWDSWPATEMCFWSVSWIVGEL